jgi:Skp family chaperone for outer membrane proteins
MKDGPMPAFPCRILLLACAGILLATMPALADNAAAPVKLPAPVVAVIDVQRILDESLAAKSVQKQLETQRSKFQTEIEKEENDLRQAEQDLSKAHDQLTPDAYSDREQQLRQRFLAVERHVQARRKVLDQAFTDSMNEVRASLLNIVDAAAHEHGANLVLIKQQILWTDKALDITDEVLGRLNAKLPQVTVKMAPEEKEEAAPPK